MSVKQIEIQCDICGSVSSSAETTQMARQNSAGEGWVVVQGKDICPSCVQEVINAQAKLTGEE